MPAIRFCDFVAARWPTPEDALAGFFGEAQASAAEVGALLTEHPTLDGSRQYLPALSGRRDKRQFLVASVAVDPDGTAWPAITFRSFKRGGASTYWKPRDAAWQLFKLAGDEAIARDDGYAERIHKAQELARKRGAEREAADELGRAAAADAARAAWDSAAPADDSHPYLQRKGVRSYGLRVASLTMRARLWDSERERWINDAIVVRAGDLLVPAHLPDGRLINVQRIDAGGRKLFLRGGQKRGTCLRIKGTGRAWLCEGYATGASVHAATNETVIIAFDTSNLVQCAGLADVVAADHDANGAGQRAAEGTGLPWTLPPQAGEDFNDLHQRAGLAAVRAGLGVLQPPPEPEPPVFARVFDLPRVEVPPGRDDALRALARIANPADAAAFAWATAKRLALGIAARGETVDSVADSLRAALPRSVLAGGTIDAIAGGVRWIVERRRDSALAAVRPSAAVLAGHDVQRVHSLPELGAEDYRGVIVLRAPMGAGKTQRVGRPFAEWARQQPGRFVALAHRQSLIAELATRLGCDHYQRVGGEEAVHADALASCLPSVVKADHAQIFREARWVFVDEISQVVRSLAARVTVADKRTMADVLAALRELVSCAPCLIVADAGIDDRTIRFLESCRPGERFRVVDVDAPRAESLRCDFGFGPNALRRVYGEMLAELADGRRLWVACGEKSRAIECARLLESSGRRVLLVHSDNSGNREQAAFLAEPDRMSRLYDAVVASPVISSGVSVEHRGMPWFDRVFLIASGATVTPADAMQMARRVRYVHGLSVAVTPSNRSEIDSADAILGGLSQAAELEGRNTLPSGLDGIVADIEAGNARQRADFAAGLWWLLEAAGYAVRPMTVAEDGEVSAESLKLLRAEIDREQRDAILGARDLGEFEARRLRERPAISEADRAALLRHRIVRDLGLQEVLCDVDLDDWNTGRGPRAWDRFTAATAGLADASMEPAGEDLTRRRFARARVSAYAELFAGFRLGPGFRITGEVAQALVQQAFARRHLLAVLGVVGAKWAGERFTVPSGRAATQAVVDLFQRMGLELKRREGTATPTSAKNTLGSLGTCGGGVERNRWYEVTAESWSRTAKLAARRNARRVLDRVPVETQDDRFWLTVRRDIIGRRLSGDEAARLIRERCQAQPACTARRDGLGRTFGARSTAFWLRNVYAAEWSPVAA
ncbi:plasmid replication protein, CyRepA1 family [Xanthomonas sacchari]|uniref:plasmid replication protein, CyRepA1 family n=1 Tax=Xanthomonas sacchari TaxID=56458 RepID=UPI003B215C92